MPSSPVPHVRGLLLAAGAGRRFGSPKALVRKDAHGPALVEEAVAALFGGGCAGVTVVVGAAAAEVRAVLATAGAERGGASGDVDLVECPNWADGMGASLRIGLAALAERPEVEAALVTLVDLPDVRAEVVARVLSGAHDSPDRSRPGGRSTGAGWRAALGRAAYGGSAGHPALLGRDHWDGVAAAATGDRGARAYYRANAHELIECGDLATGRDVDRPEDLAAPD